MAVLRWGGGAMLVFGRFAMILLSVPNARSDGSQWALNIAFGASNNVEPTVQRDGHAIPVPGGPDENSVTPGSHAPPSRLWRRPQELHRHDLALTQEAIGRDTRNRRFNRFIPSTPRVAACIR